MEQAKTGSSLESTPVTNQSGENQAGETFLLKLYVAGQTPRSMAAIENLQKICEVHLKGRYQIEVVDLARNPKLARTDKILAIPTLVRNLPTPISRIIGDLSDEEQVLIGLNIKKL